MTEIKEEIKEVTEKEEIKKEKWEPNPAFIEMEECFKYLDKNLIKE